jgi:hypothetical protein
MIHGNRFGDVPPPWFTILEVGRYLKVPPDYVEDKLPLHWFFRAIEAMNAQGRADELKRKNQHEQDEMKGTR